MVRDSSRKLHLPIRFIQGRWELEAGGEAPVVEGARAELVLPETAISDPNFLARYRQKTHIKIVPIGTPLRACLNVKGPDTLGEELQTALIPWDDMRASVASKFIKNWSSTAYSYVEVFIGPPKPRQAALFEMHDGGLWLTIEGNKAVALTTSQIRLPEALGPDHASSLNHAFTKLSEAYEPWRLAHTGSVYERFLYQEKDGLWYPLELLRDASVAEVEQSIAFDLWKQFLARMSSGAPAKQ